MIRNQFIAAALMLLSQFVGEIDPDLNEMGSLSYER